MQRSHSRLFACGLLALGVGACGSSSSNSHGSAVTAAPTPASPAKSSQPAGALSAEARSLATGDIPDNQIFLTYHNPVGHYSMVYPEGWSIKAQGANATISDKNNIVRVVIVRGAAPTPATVSAELNHLKQQTPTLTFTTPVRAGNEIKVRYSTRSAPDPVTGRSVLLLVDRYELAHGSTRATVDLGTPKGVDNVDAYRKMINSFHWQ